jgi:lysophospholipase L1-like esterase
LIFGTPWRRPQEEKGMGWRRITCEPIIAVHWHELIISDGVHFTSAGYRVVWEELSVLIRAKFAGRGLDFEDFDDLPYRVPW